MAYSDCNLNFVKKYQINVKSGQIVKYYCQISPVFSPLYVRISSTILKFFHFTSNTCIFLKTRCLFLAIFLKLTFNKKEKCRFIRPKTLDFLFQKPSNFYSEKKSYSLKVAVPEFQKHRKK